SGYLQRAKGINPKNATQYPWRLNQEYVADRKLMASDPVDDGILVFSRASANAKKSEEQLEAAE
ncbi:MAG: FAD-containing monooxygenase EthA, partial [Pseudomonadota bacterium]